MPKIGQGLAVLHILGASMFAGLPAGKIAHVHLCRGSGMVEGIISYGQLFQKQVQRPPVEDDVMCVDQQYTRPCIKRQPIGIAQRRAAQIEGVRENLCRKALPCLSAKLTGRIGMEPAGGLRLDDLPQRVIGIDETGREDWMRIKKCVKGTGKPFSINRAVQVKDQRNGIGARTGMLLRMQPEPFLFACGWRPGRVAPLFQRCVLVCLPAGNDLRKTVFQNVADCVSPARFLFKPVFETEGRKAVAATGCETVVSIEIGLIKDLARNSQQLLNFAAWDDML